ncbi:Acyl CoA binding protein, putative [Cordyceps militaris CM01]|uniref:Acyl CoA binding protein, putative n=1 Tax=Cordyceps militaris (strain CM01) TaxID=983644 RepID=G3JFW4_CORMM|nr:Acyl CoA binding protein, putative [Cordyceps militaris CM01]EGX93198.1 Acyl CoA binding protein, putative [Cordyceps militaris CM01]
MADSVDRVFVHALNTVKKIPKTGASRPPPSERLRLYGLYKQAMEGDVDGVMEQPMAGAGLTAEELQRERDKWDAWNCQKGISRTEAKRRYIEALIETMHRYATTADGRELVSELEFVWNQIKNNSPSASDSSPQAASAPRRFTQPMSGSEGPLKILSPMSEQDEAELRSHRQMDLEDREMGHDVSVGSGRSQRKMERAITKLSAEVAALREQISTGREWKSKKARSLPSWLGWLVWSVMKHLLIDCVILSLILVWMRKRKDRRLEDLVRAALTLVREYVRNIVPTRAFPRVDGRAHAAPGVHKFQYMQQMRCWIFATGFDDGVSQRPDATVCTYTMSCITLFSDYIFAPNIYIALLVSSIWPAVLHFRPLVQWFAYTPSPLELCRTMTLWVKL